MWIKDLVRGWFLHTISGVLGRQRELHQEGDVEVEAERHWSDVATSQGVPSATRSWRSKEWVLSIDLPRSRFHLKLFLNFWPPKLQRIHSCCPQTSGFWSFVTITSGTQPREAHQVPPNPFPVGAFSWVGQRTLRHGRKWVSIFSLPDCCRLFPIL